MSWKSLDAHGVDSRATLRVEPLNPRDSVLFEINAPFGRPVPRANGKLVQLSNARLEPELSHFVFELGKLEERAAGV